MGLGNRTPWRPCLPVSGEKHAWQPRSGQVDGNQPAGGQLAPAAWGHLAAPEKGPLRWAPCHGPQPGRSDHVLSSPHRPQAQVQSQVRGATAGLPGELLVGAPGQTGPAPGKPRLRALPGLTAASRSLGPLRPGSPGTPLACLHAPALVVCFLNAAAQPRPTPHAPWPPPGHLGGWVQWLRPGHPELVTWLPDSPGDRPSQTSPPKWRSQGGPEPRSTALPPTQLG